MQPVPDHDTVLVVDFGAQYAQLIARRVRECQVHSEIVPATMPAAQMLALRPKAIILSGGPSSVYAEGAPPVPAGLLGAGVPVLGICYGFQAMVAELGGTVARTPSPLAVAWPGGPGSKAKSMEHAPAQAAWRARSCCPWAASRPGTPQC